jgi:hypothetical protein
VCASTVAPFLCIDWISLCFSFNKLNSLACFNFMWSPSDRRIMKTITVRMKLVRKRKAQLSSVVVNDSEMQVKQLDCISEGFIVRKAALQSKPVSNSTSLLHNEYLHEAKSTVKTFSNFSR